MSKKIILQILISSLRVIGVTLLLVTALYFIYYVQYNYVDEFILELNEGPEFNSKQSMENAAWIIERISYILPISLLAILQTVPYLGTMKKKAAIGHFEKGLEAVLFFFVFLFGIVSVFKLSHTLPDLVEWLNFARPDFYGKIKAEPEMLHGTLSWISVQLIGCIIWMTYHFVRCGYLAHPKKEVLDAETEAEQEPDCDELDEELENKCSQKVLRYLEFKKDKKDGNGDISGAGRKNKK